MHGPINVRSKFVMQKKQADKQTNTSHRTYERKKVHEDKNEYSMGIIM